MNTSIKRSGGDSKRVNSQNRAKEEARLSSGESTTPVSEKIDEGPGSIDRSVFSEREAKEIVATWSTEWSSALPQRDPADAARLVREAVEATRGLQRKANAESNGAVCPVHRGFQAKGTYATTQAKLRIAPNLPEALRVGPFQPGAEYRAVVRFSNASPTVQSDELADQRAVAFRIVGEDGKIQDITLTSGSGENHAKDAEEFVASIRAAGRMSDGGIGAKVAAVAALAGEIGPVDALKVARASKRAKDEGVSLAANTFYSRAPFQLGPYAVKLRLCPADEVDPRLVGQGGNDALTQDFVERRQQGSVRYRLQVQGFKNPDETSMADHRRPWTSPWVTIAQLAFPKQHRASEGVAREVSAEVSNKLAFTPFNQWDGEDGQVLKPLGDLNMLRKEVYQESAKESGRSGPATRGCPFLHG